MSRKVPVDDVFAAAVPEYLRDAKVSTIARHLSQMAQLTAVAQFKGDPDLLRIENFRTEWLITTDYAKVERFQPAHDCVACRAGSDQIKAHLREHPDIPVALGNLHYVEVWRR